MYRRRMYMFALGLALVLATGVSAQVQGKVLIDYWFGNGIGGSLSTLTGNADFPNSPAYGEYIDAMDRPDFTDMDYWGARLQAWLTPPATGDYTFWTASDDDSQVWLSTDDTAANVALICSVTGWGGYQDWTGTTGSMGTNFKSAPVTLEAGKRYYIETLFTDGTGGGFVSVAWAGPVIGDAPTVIGSAYLSAPASDSPFIARDPNPASGAADVTAPLFMWTSSANAATDDVYFGTNPTPGPAEFKGKQSSMQQLYFHMDLLEPGAKYYWRVDTTDTAGVLHTGRIWTFTVMPVKATVPDPADGTKGMAVNLTLSWKAGQNEPTHDLYLGSDKAAVEAGDASVFKGNLVDAMFDANGLAFDTTYYWRVDEIDLMGTKTVGDVWSFKTTLESLGKITRQIWENIGGGTAVSDLTNNALFPLKPTWTDIVTSFRSPDLGKDNYGGRMSAWLHVPADGDYTFWIASDDASQLWFGTTPGTAVQIASVAGWAGDMAWDSNASQKSAVQKLTAGVYFIDALWKEGGGGDHCSVAWQGPDITRQVIPGGYCEYFVGYWTQAPKPANAATGVSQTTTLGWAPGVKAAKHNVYFGDSLGGVTGATPTSTQFKGALDAAVTTFNPGALAWDKTYYWRVDEVNDADAGSPWKGAVWTFTTAGYLFINNDQRTLNYDNGLSPFFSELAYTVPADLTVNGTQALYLEFIGAAGAAANGSTTIDGPGAYTLKGSGTDIWNASDQFQFAYMQLTGDGSIQAKVESVENVAGSGGWSKGGVMIRQSAGANSVYAIEAVSGGGAGNGGGVGFQWRPSTGASATAGPDGPGIAAPYWVKLTRVGNEITGFNSADGVTWTQQGTPQTIAMTDPVLIGVCYTSHVNATTFGTSKLTNVGVAGNVNQASANNLDVGLGNSAQPIYVAVQDTAGKLAVATYPEAAATNIPSWTLWKVPLSSLVGVDLTKVAKLSIGVGDSLNPQMDGLGVINVRNVRVVKPVAMGSPISSVVRANGTSGDRSPCGAFDGARAPLGTQSGGLRSGNYVYSDRDYPWSTVPAELVGAGYVRIFNTDKGTAAGTYTVTLSREATVMICHDDRNTPGQDLVDKIVAAFATPGTFVDTGLDVCVYESATVPARPLSVFAAVLPAGTYVFATEASGNTHYVIAAMDTMPADVTVSSDNVLGLPNNFNWPAAEFPRNVIDNNTGTKFLDFSGKTDPTGFAVQPFVGSSIVTGLTFTSANDAAERDPVKYELSGSNDSIQGPWTAIAAGDIVDFAGATAWARTTKGTTPITFANTTAYKFYKVMFPVVRNPATANSMQIAEVELIGVLAK
jgi:hypothetical protein